MSSQAAISSSCPQIMRPYSVVSRAVAKRGRLILFHGLTSHPYDFLHLLSDRIAQSYDIIAPCLAGHGTNLKDLQQTHIEAWFDDVDRVVEAHSTATGPLFVGGSSLGSLLAILVARRLPVRGLILMAPPTRLRVWYHEPLLQLLSHLPDHIISSLGAVPKEAMVTEPRIAYPARSIAASVRLLMLRRQALAALSFLSLPILVLHDPFDTLVVAEAPDHITAIATQSRVDTVPLPHGLHELNVGPSQEELRTALWAFLEANRDKNTS